MPLSIAKDAADELLLTKWNGAEGIPDLLETGDQAAENDAALADLMGRLGGIGG